MAATLTTLVSNVTAPVDYVLMKALLSAARKKCPFFNGSLPGTLEKKGGSASVKWRRIENLTAATTALSEVSGTAAAFLGRSAVQPTITDVTVAIAKYGNAVLLTEEVDLFNVNSDSYALMNTLGANAGESLNALMQTALASGTTAIRYSTGTVSGGSAVTDVMAAITLNDIKYATNYINRGSGMTFTPIGMGSTNVGTQPIRPSYYGICHPDVEEDIRGLTGFIPVEAYAGYTETEPFEVGAVGGVRWCVSEICTLTSGAGTDTSDGTIRGATTILNDVYDSYVYGAEAFGSVGLGNMHATNSYEMYDPKTPPAVELIYHKPGTSGVFDMFNEVGSIAWKAWFAGKVLNANWIVRIRSGASKL